MLRPLLRSSSALVLAAAAILIGWRVLAPAEVLAPVTTPLPTPAPRSPGVTGRANAAPLIVDDRIRVYAAKRQVRADAAIDEKSVYTAVWSFRRWPEQLSGVVASGRTVVSRWSDGDLVAIDATTGKIIWRTSGPPATGFRGHRTGAGTVWDPAGLRVGTGSVLVTAGGSLIAYAISTGTKRWSASCAGGFPTAGGQFVCPGGAFDVMTGRPSSGFPIGPSTPLGCDVASSRCAGLRDAAGHGWLTDGPAPRRAVALDQPGSTTAAGLIYTPYAGGLRVAEPDGKPVRDYPGADRVLGVCHDGVVLLTAARHALVVNPRAGTTIADVPMAYGSERLTWDPGGWQVTAGHVAIERLTAGGPADPDTPGHYFSIDTVVLASV